MIVKKALSMQIQEFLILELQYNSVVGAKNLSPLLLGALYNKLNRIF